MQKIFRAPLFSLSLLLGMGLHTYAADTKSAQWTKSQIAELKKNLTTGICGQKGISELRADVCAAYGLEKALAPSKPLGQLSQISSSHLHIESRGQILKLERTSENAVFLLNRTPVDTRLVSNRKELRERLEKALPRKTASFFWIQPAYAADLDPQVTSMLQIFIEESVQFGSCDLYLRFSKKCIAGLTFVYQQIRNTKGKLAASKLEGGGQQMSKSAVMEQIKGVNGQLNDLLVRFQGVGFPGLETNSSLDLCAKKERLPLIEVEAEKERLRTCYEMQVGLRDYTQALVDSDTSDSKAAIEFLSGIVQTGTAVHPLHSTPPGSQENLSEESMATK